MSDGNMLTAILQHSKINVAETCSSLSTNLLIGAQQELVFDQIPSYIRDLSALRDVIRSVSDVQNGNGDKLVYEAISKVTNDICLPFLKFINPSFDARPDLLELLGKVSQTLAECVVADQSLQNHVLEVMISFVATYLKEKPSTFDFVNDKNLVDIHSILEALRTMLGRLAKKFELIKSSEIIECFRKLFEMLCDAMVPMPVDLVGRLCIPVLLQLVKLVGHDHVPVDIENVWKKVVFIHEEENLRKEFVLLCGFANYFFPTDGHCVGLDLRAEKKFWLILQTGLYSKDSVNRKRALYLLKRVVDICESMGADVNSTGSQHMFWWSKDQAVELSKVWEDFMMLAEVLEERQVHVIKPLLPRIKSLIKATGSPSSNGRALLHCSWVKTVLLRGSHHESLQIIRWSAETVLGLNLAECPMLDQGLDDYIAGEMLYSLQEPKLYSREVGARPGSMPPIAERLMNFFQTCSTVLPQNKKGALLRQTVRNICSQHWGSIPLLFICRALASIPQCPCLDGNTVLLVRKLLTGSLVAVEAFIRGAMQGYLVKILICLTDKTKVSVDDFLTILCQMKREESLQRGTVLWSQCVDWLKQETADGQSEWSSEGLRKYIDQAVVKYLETTHDSKYSSADAASALMVARLLVLTSDAAIVTQEDESGFSTLGRTYENLRSVVCSINTHAYMSPHKADKAMLLLTLLLKELGPKGAVLEDPVAKGILLSWEGCQSEMVEYINRRLQEAIVTLSDLSTLELYEGCVQHLTTLTTTIRGVRLNTLVSGCIACLQGLSLDQSLTLHRKLQQLSCMCILGTIADFLSCDQQSNQSDLTKQICDFIKTWTIMTTFPKLSSEGSISQQEWGRVASKFLQSQWRVVKFATQRDTFAISELQNVLTCAEESLSVGMETTSVLVLKCLKLVIPKVVESGTCSDERLATILDACWRSVKEARRILPFWDVLEAFVHVAYLPCLLAMPEQSHVTSELAMFAENLLEMGTDKNGVVNYLANQLHAAFTEHQGMLGHLQKYVTIIVDLCMFGGLVRRGVRQVYDICAALEATGDECPANGVLPPNRNEDIHVKVKVISILCHLDPGNHDHCCLATSIIRECFRRYALTVQGAFNHFANSTVHRQRHRLVQTILLLQGLVTEDSVGDLWQETWTSLELEIHPSVRHMLEWLVLSFLYTYVQFRQQLWDLFLKYRDTKSVTMCSLLCIITHLGPHLPRKDQPGFYNEALRHILPWCMAHHFQSRIYSQVVLVKLWDQLHALGLHDVLQQHAILQCIVDFNQKNCNSTKNVKKLLDSFYFKYLDFRDDFTLETIYNVMPMMTGLTEEDWIAPELFNGSFPNCIEGRGSSIIGLRNTTDKFNKCDPSLWKYVTLKIHEDGSPEEGGDSDVQKKIMPWRQMMLDEEVVAEVEYGIKQPPGGGLVVVTSLINKVPNLGGLCRTSEIFGVSEYVLGKLQYTEDKGFQGLSVTAQKWITVTEVPELKLGDYLQQKRLEGYTLVGVEQTANSVCLTEYEFPTKTLLVLGNEKEGIPADLISLLDVCVEIPQQGVIRSLNVHVSGAILIWEYRRQQLMKSLNS